jgi:hypothetical protein
VGGEVSLYDGKSAEDIIQYMYTHGMTQEGVNRVYEMRRLGAAPQLPANMVGAKRQATKGGAHFYNNGKRVLDSGTSAFTSQFNRQAIDPFRSYTVGNYLGLAGMIVGSAGAGAALGAGSAAGAAGGAGAGSAGGVGAGAANGLATGFANGLGAATGAAAGGAAGTAAGAGAGALGGGLGVFANGGAGGLAGVGGGNAGALAASGGITGGAGTGGTIQGALGGLSGVANSVSGVGGGAAGGGGMAGGGLWDNIGEAIKIGGSLYNTYQQGEGAKDASRASQAGYQAGIDEQRRQFDIIMGMLEPQRNFGNAALGELSGVFGYNGAAGVATPNAGSSVGSTGIGINGAGGITQGVQAAPGAAGAAPATVGPPNFGAFFKSPDYQFRRDEGTRDIGNSFAARGGALSGNALRGITDFNSNLASGEFDNFIQRRLQAAGLGGAATSQGVNAANYTGANVANLLGNQGNARASGIVDRTNATTGGLNDISQWYGNFLRNRQIGVGG